MMGRSHLLVGLSSAIVFDSVFHISGDPFTVAKTVPLALILNKVIYYSSAAFGALLPDIDNAHSTLGLKLGFISKEIQHIAGHRRFFHSLLGLVFGSLLAIGLEQVIIVILAQHNLIMPAEFIRGSHVVFFGVLFGCVMHITADALTLGGVPLFWPSHKRYGFPQNPKFRFRTGSWPEFVVVWTLILLVICGVFLSIIII